MSEIIARMAKAMAPVFTNEGMPISCPDEGPLDDVGQARWDTLLQAAHASLLAIGAPTNAMANAGTRVLAVDWNITCEGRIAPEIWSAMVEEARK